MINDEWWLEGEPANLMCSPAKVFHLSNWLRGSRTHSRRMLNTATPNNSQPIFQDLSRCD